MAELQPNIVFHGRHFVRNIEICNPICVKLLQVTHTQTDRHTHIHTYTHTHDDSIRRNAIRCISPKNETFSILIIPNLSFR